MKNTENEELKRLHCSVLMEEIKERVRILMEYGVRETDIISYLFNKSMSPQLFISKNYRMFVGDDRKEIHMEPLVKAVYLLFLNHPEGILFKCLPDYREELAIIYAKLRPWGLSNRALRSIEDVTNPLLNSINEKCARIRKTFLDLMDSNLAEHYYIKGTRGEPKNIALPRDLVIWE